MIFSTSSKLIFLATLMVAVSVQPIYANDQKPDDYGVGPNALSDHRFAYYGVPKPPQCPPEGMAFYKDCNGSVNGCSTCLQKAEKMCRINVDQSVNCNDCTNLAGSKCQSAEPMCFGTQECDGAAYKCINFSCQYDP